MFLILMFCLAEDNQFGGLLKQPVAPAAELSGTSENLYQCNRGIKNLTSVIDLIITFYLSVCLSRTHF
jgi:hypothetical protein